MNSTCDTGFCNALNVSQFTLIRFTLISLFDTNVFNILNHSCEIWGNQKGPGVGKVLLLIKQRNIANYVHSFYSEMS